jgi:hypothetical protein
VASDQTCPGVQGELELAGVDWGVATPEGKATTPGLPALRVMRMRSGPEAAISRGNCRCSAPSDDVVRAVMRWSGPAEVALRKIAGVAPLMVMPETPVVWPVSWVLPPKEALPA